MKNIARLTTEKSALETYLKGQGWLLLNESLNAVEIPGAGNMNLTLRIKTRERSFIIKQSRDYVEKYPQVPAPEKRALREAEFYELIALEDSLSSMMPVLNGVDRINNVLNLEDLGDSRDYSFLYEEGVSLSLEDLKEIIAFISQLHTTVNTATTQATLANVEMRKLNHEHIYNYPYLDDNGLNLDSVLMGLAEIAAPYKNDAVLKAELQKLGNRYLANGTTLLHGDYFPGSWLKTKAGIKIIDPEFCFFGDPEFEMGVTLAHLKMAAQPEALIDSAIDLYTEKGSLDRQLCFKYMAAEILRRILGLAQLPLTLTLAKRKELLEESRSILVRSNH
ncbi:phosphotransferase [Leeuwenhoekiella sp. NPDC079379]|uniref:phosphotransferase n=1 Tax=Leeuwenhoekiella sp. NPDC079379 TaxID=3364122 RepID=UPI0037CC5C3C